MTYSALQLFKSIFFSENLTTSDCSAHLNGTKALSAKPAESRFVFAKWVDGEIPNNTPLVKFIGEGERWLGLFFKRKPADGKALFSIVSKYFPLGLEFPEEVELPFFGATMERLSPLDGDGNPFRFLEEALEFIQSKAVEESDISQWEDSLSFKDAPFCVQSYYLLSNELPRFAGPYLDAKDLPTKFAGQAERFSKNTEPMDCKNIKWLCDKEVCSKRKYGCKSPLMSELFFGKLTQYKEDPVFYVWEIDGKEVRFDSELDLMRQDRFMPIAMRELGRLPRRLSNDAWLRIVNKALANMKVVGKSETAKLTIDRLRDVLVGDLKERTLVGTFYEYERLNQGWIYLDPSSSSFVVDPVPLCSYITGRYPDIRIDKIQDFYAALRHLGFRSKSKSVDGSNRTLWFVRSQFLFDTRQQWVDYMLDISRGTSWEMNFRAFLTDEDSGIEPLEDCLKEEIDASAAVFLDTEKEIDNGRV